MTADRPGADRRTEILEAAIRVLARDGIAQASTRKLAAEAGINQATLLYYVGSKDELLLAVLREMMRQTREIAIAAATEHVLPLREAIANSVRAFWHHVEATPELQVMQYELTLYALRNPESAWLAREQYSGYCAVVEGVLRATCEQQGNDLRRLLRCAGPLHRRWAGWPDSAIRERPEHYPRPARSRSAHRRRHRAGRGRCPVETLAQREIRWEETACVTTMWRQRNQPPPGDLASDDATSATARDYNYYRRAFAGHAMPFAWLDLDLLDKNIRAVVGRSRARSMCASPRSRCAAWPCCGASWRPDPVFHGLMCFTAREAAWLAGQGIRRPAHRLSRLASRRSGGGGAGDGGRRAHHADGG